MNQLRRASFLCFLLLTVLCATLPAMAAEEQFTVLFVHDLHSHLLPANDENGVSYGGYARLKTVLDQQRALHPDALVLDGGDFSMGSLFQTSFRTSAIELRVMGALGIDATTFGNHEYDYGPRGLGDMLFAAKESGDPLPAIVETSYLPPAAGDEGDSPDAQYVRESFQAAGVKDYVLLERGGVWFAVFSSFGTDAEECAPTSGMISQDRYACARQAIQRATEDCRRTYGAEPVVVCLSHSGTQQRKGEDYELAEQVDGIDLIISAHTHTTLDTPIVDNHTAIVSAGAYSKTLGVVTMERDGNGNISLVDYALIPIDASVAEDPAMAEKLEDYKQEVERDYLSLFGLGFDEVLVQNPYAFDSVDAVYATAHESTLGNLISDAYLWAAEAFGGEAADVALTASGVIRESLPMGDVTVSDVFTAASLGDGGGQVPGGALLSVYLTGADLKNVLEVDASIQPIMPAAQLFCSGVAYRFNTHRMLFNKVDDAALRLRDGTLVPIENDRLYHFVTGTYVGNMLGAVEKRSFGLLSVTPRDRNGAPIDMTRLSDYILRDGAGNEVKEWYAIAAYLRTMGGQMDSRYAQGDGRKVILSDSSPLALLRSANRFTWAAVGFALVLFVLLPLAAYLICRRKRAHPKRKQPL